MEILYSCMYDNHLILGMVCGVLIILFILGVFLLSRTFCISSILVVISLFIFFGYTKYSRDRNIEYLVNSSVEEAKLYLDKIDNDIKIGKNIIVIDKNILHFGDNKYLIEAESSLLDKDYRPIKETGSIIYYKKD